MRYLLLLLVTLIPTSVFSQGYLGQTREYIIKENSFCRIDENSKESLWLRCADNNYTGIYYFDDGALTCQSYIILYPLSYTAEVKASFLERGFKKYKSVDNSTVYYSSKAVVYIEESKFTDNQVSVIIMPCSSFTDTPCGK